MRFNSTRSFSLRLSSAQDFLLASCFDEKRAETNARRRMLQQAQPVVL